jgi:hypothetical protein
VDRLESASALRDRRELLIVLNEILREAKGQLAERAREIEKLKTEIRRMTAKKRAHRKI